MRRAFTLAIALLLLGLALPSTSAGNGNGGGNDSCKATVLENDDFRLWFHGKKAFFKVDDKANGRGYDYRTHTIEEVDANGNRVAAVKMNNASPQTSTCTVVTEGNITTFTLVTDEVATPTGGNGGGNALGNPTVTFVYHYNHSANGAKFDLHVDNWPWQATDSQLAFGFSVDARGQTIESAENGVGFRNETGAPTGYMEWAPNATAFYAEGHNETAIVDSDTTVANNQTAEVTLAFTNVTAGYDRLVYDPWVGIGAYIVIGGILIADPTRMGLLDLATALVDAVL